MTETQERVARRLGLLGPGPAAFFTDACRLVDEVRSGRWPLATATHLISHLLRELDSSVRYVLYAQVVETPAVVDPEPPAALEPGRDIPVETGASLGHDAAGSGEPVERAGGDDGDDEASGPSQLEQVKAILRALEFPADSPELRQWRALGKGASALHRLTHRDALNPPRPLTEQFVATFQAITGLYDVVLDRFEARYATVYDRLDRLLALENPTRDELRMLRTGVPNTPRTLGYFFQRLQHPGWLDPLAAAGFFRAPPPPDVDPVRNTIGFPHWMAADYLGRMASVRPARVAEIVVALPDTENMRVRAQLIDVLLALRPEDRAAMAPRVEQWVAGLARYHWGDQAPRFALALLHDDAVGHAFTLTERVLDLPEGWGDAPSPNVPSFVGERERAWHLREAAGTLFPALIRRAPERALALLAGALEYHVGRLPADLALPADTVEGLSDYSGLWARDLGADERADASDLRVFLVHLIREGARQVGTETPGVLPTIVAVLRQRAPRVLRRIELAALSDLLGSTEEAVRAPALPIAIERLTTSAILVEVDLDGEVGTLLQAVFPWASSAERQRVLDALVPPAFEWIPDEYRAGRRAQWRRDRLALVADHLPPRERGELTALTATEGEPEPLHRPGISVTSFAGHPSPLDAEALRTMDLEEILGFLASWRPRAERDAPTREGLSRQLEAVVTADAARYAAWAARFIGQHPVYLEGLIDGLRAAARADRVFPWPDVLALLDWVVVQEVPADDMTERREAGPDYEWRSVRRGAADLMGLAFERPRDGGAPPIEERERLWRIISALSEDVNPSPAYEARWGGSNMDPTTMAINTTRPEAIDAAIRFAFWSVEHRTTPGERLRAVLVQEPEVAALLERHLDPGRDSSLAVRAAVGRWLTPLARTDADWVAAHRGTLLPAAVEHRALRDALWDAFTHWSQPHPDALAVLEPEYRAAIARLRDGAVAATPRSRGGERPEDRLAEHVVALYWWGAISLESEGNLLAYFFSHADARRRAHALHHTGFSLYHAQGEPDAVALRRLQHLWDWRAAALQRALGGADSRSASSTDGPGEEGPELTPEEARDELREFGWWFAAAVFNPAWSLDRLEQALRLTGNVELDHAVAEHLAELAPREPRRVASCLLAVDFTGGTEPWSVHSWIEHIPAILRPVLLSDDREIARMGQEVVHRVVAAGYTEHRALLRAGDDPQAPPPEP